jgi:hypothetical protein
VIWRLAPNAPKLVEASANAAVRVEAATGWSFEAVTNYMVVMVILFLLAVQRALGGLTRFFLQVLHLMRWAPPSGHAPDVPTTPPSTRWVWTALMAWGASIAVVHLLG